MTREFVDRDTGQEVRRGDRLGGRLEEPAEWRGEGEHHRAPALGPDVDLVPGSGGRTGVGRVLQDMDGEGDVVGGDRFAVVPAGVRPQLEGPHRARRVDRPALGQVRDE